MNTHQELTLDVLDTVNVGETYLWTYYKTYTVTITKLTKHIIFCIDADGNELEINR